MSLRKARYCSLGKSSTDIRTALETKAERKERPALYQSIYPYHESQLSLPRVKTLPFLVHDPIQTQTEYYKKQEKKLHMRQSMARPKSSEFKLEKQSFDKYLKRSPNQQESLEEHKERKVDKYHVSKEVEHKKASQETQLVHIEKHSTLEGKVDLKKVADIRRTIRRRYANRNDFRKIFNQWDKNSSGVLTAQEVAEMVNKIGIPINMHEARVLVASANKSNTGALNLNEFMGLIFDQDDKMNVDLSLLADDNESNLRIIDMHNLAVNKHTEMIQNQLKGFLKEKYHGLAPQFTRKDKNKTGKINFEDFVSVLNNMDVPLALSSEKSWTKLFNDSADKNALDYKHFLKKLDEFLPEPSHDSPKLEEEKAYSVESRKSVQLQSPPVTDPLANLNILNRQKVPVNQLDNFFLRARKIRLFLRDNIKSEPELVNELKDRSGGQVISLNSLKDYVIDKLQEKKTMKITKKELEGFLSSYIYNKDGVTPIEEVAKNIFMEDTKASFELHKFKRSIPPIREADEFEVESAECVKKMLNSIEEKFFDQGPQKANEIFKKFDRDRDGYITLDDLEKALVINQIVHEPHEVKHLMAFLDSNKNGFVTYKEFNDKIRANILVVNKDRLQENPEKFSLTHQPSLEYLKTQQGKLNHFSKIQEDLIKEFRPDDKIIKFTSNTRYGAKPPHQDTFVNFNCGDLVSDPPKKFQPINVGGEEKLNKLRSDALRVELLKKSRDDRAVRLKVIEDNVLMKDQGKIFMRALSKEEYEKRCKLSSPFANMSIE